MTPPGWRHFGEFSGVGRPVAAETGPVYPGCRGRGAPVAGSAPEETNHPSSTRDTVRAVEARVCSLRPR